MMSLELGQGEREQGRTGTSWSLTGGQHSMPDPWLRLQRGLHFGAGKTPFNPSHSGWKPSPMRSAENSDLQ